LKKNLHAKQLEISFVYNELNKQKIENQALKESNNKLQQENHSLIEILKQKVRRF
jgi:hypothetical protein